MKNLNLIKFLYLSSILSLSCIAQSHADSEHFYFIYGNGIDSMEMKFGYSYGQTAASNGKINGSAGIHNDAYKSLDVTVKTSITSDGSTSIANYFNQNYYKLKMELNNGQTNAINFDFWLDQISLYINGNQVDTNFALARDNQSIDPNNSWWIGTSAGSIYANSNNFNSIEIHDVNNNYYCLNANSPYYDSVVVTAGNCTDSHYSDNPTKPGPASPA